jgi:hypothetical protein
MCPARLDRYCRCGRMTAISCELAEAVDRLVELIATVPVPFRGKFDEAIAEVAPEEERAKPFGPPRYVRSVAQFGTFR